MHHFTTCYVIRARAYLYRPVPRTQARTPTPRHAARKDALGQTYVCVLYAVLTMTLFLTKRQLDMVFPFPTIDTHAIDDRLLSVGPKESGLRLLFHPLATVGERSELTSSHIQPSLAPRCPSMTKPQKLKINIGCKLSRVRHTLESFAAINAP